MVPVIFAADLFCNAGRRRGHVEDTAHRLHRGRDRVRSGGLERHLFGQRAAGDFRYALRLRLPRAALSADDAHRGGDAGSYRRGPDVDHAREARHLFRRRSGIQGQEARARRRRLRLFVEAPARPEGALAVRLVPAGQGRRRRSGARGGEADRTLRLRRADRRAGGARSLHLAAEAQGPGLHHGGLHDAVADGRGRARSHRSACGCEWLGDGQSRRHRPVPAQVVAARRADRARGESQLPR